MSSMLRTRGAPGESPLMRARGEDFGPVASPISSILRTGERGARGDEARPDPELTEPLLRALGGLSNSARTSLRSSSNIDSNDMFCAMVATADCSVFAVSSWRCCCALREAGQ